MGNIKLMSESLSNKIAAGEVVERPLSVVKELVENSIDAGSSKIYITLKNSGIDYISVVDDGTGMDGEDAMLCFSRHASSKLTSDEMLFKIATLGFRGEALSSIAAVSNVVLETCNGEESTYLEIEAGEVLKCSPTIFRKGTGITVTKLFYNTPARLKYIKNLYSESAKILEYVSRCALANPNIVFKLMNDGKSIIETNGSGDYLKTIRDIYSVEVVKHLTEINIKATDMTIKLFAANPVFQRSNKNYMSVFVNKRVVNSPAIVKVIIEAYKDYMPRNRFPFCIVDIEIEPELIDVNIHPNKYEIKFSKDEQILRLIVDNLKKFLGDEDHAIEYVADIDDKYENINFDLTRDEKAHAESLDLFIKEFDEKEEYVAQEVVSEVKKETLIPVQETRRISREKTYYEPIGQFDGTYILAQTVGELILVDQHAAVERINYEKNKAIFERTDHTSVDLIVPLVISKSLEEFHIIKNNLNRLLDVGVELYEFGENDFVIRRLPSWIEQGNEEAIVDLVLEKVIHNEPISLVEIKDEVIELMSCKESLKANTRISIEEMEYILDNLMKCENPYHCPHGRPIIVSLSLKEIERLFKRVV